MIAGTERRRWHREKMLEPGLAMIHGNHGTRVEETAAFFVGVHEISSGGTLIESDWALSAGEQIPFILRVSGKGGWQSRHARVVWVKPASYGMRHLAGLEILNPAEHSLPDSLQSAIVDTEFLLKTSLLEYLPTHAVWPLLNHLHPIHFKAGDKMISQGEKGDFLCIIQSGACVVEVRKNGKMHRVARLSTGEVVGEMASLTGEPRFADVTAETDLKLWRLSRKQLDALAAEFSDIRIFLTELVTNRLESSPVSADRIIGKYLVGMKLDQGGWGIVYQGSHRLLNKPVAIKMLKHQMAMDPVFQQQFMREAKTIARLNHHNIVHVYDIEEQYKTIFIVMEYLDGHSLESLLTRLGRMTVSQTVDILMQTCAGLHYAHERNIVHHDIKPANLFVQTDGQVKVLDFGLAFSAGSDTGNLKGTIHYVAPEQLRGDPIDHRVDVYTLGLTAYEMVTGKRPHDDEDIGLLIRRREQENVPDPGEEVDDLPADLRRFIMKAGRCISQERYQTIQEAIAELKPLHERFVLGERQGARELLRMATVNLFFAGHDEGKINILLEEMSLKAREMGIDYRISEFRDIRRVS